LPGPVCRLRQRDFEDAPVDDRLCGLAVGLAGHRQFRVEKQRSVLTEIAELLGDGLLPAGFDGQPTAVGDDLGGVGGHTRHVEDEPVGLVGFQQVRKHRIRKFSERIAQC